MEAFGRKVDRSLITRNEEVFEVMPVNWESVMSFLAVATQWRAIWQSVGFAGALAWLGLDYSAVDVVLRRRGASDQVFFDIQIMEGEALAAFDAR